VKPPPQWPPEQCVLAFHTHHSLFPFPDPNPRSRNCYQLGREIYCVEYFLWKALEFEPFSFYCVACGKRTIALSVARTIHRLLTITLQYISLFLFSFFFFCFFLFFCLFEPGG
jgi:hypothetical protein